MATKHVVVESMRAVRVFLAGGGSEAVCFHTHSPGLERRLASEGLLVRGLEESIGLDVFNALSGACYAAAKNICAILDEQCPGRGYFEFGQVIEGGLVKILFVPAYKALLLNGLMAGTGGEPVTVVGDPAAPEVDGSPNWRRLETLFARLAFRAGSDALRVFELATDPEEDDRAEKRVTHRRMGLVEKVASLCNNTPASFACKLWRTLARKGLWPGRHCSLTPRPGNVFYLGKDCELIDEAFLSILRRGGAVGLLPPLPRIEARPDVELPGREALDQSFEAAMKKALAAEGIDLGALEGAAVAVARDKALDFVEALYSALPGLTESFSGIVDGLAPGATVLTNGYFDPVGRMFTAYCGHRGVEVVSFEHGATLGLSKWAEWGVRHFGALTGEVGVYHTREAAGQAAAFAPDQKRVVGGLPEVTRRVTLPGVQRWLARRLLGVGRKERVVVFVAELERNNFVFGPFADNDHQFAAKTEAALKAAIEAFPDATFFIKPYPSFRHAEPLTYDAIADQYDNVRIVDDMDFRFIRTAADVIVLTSSQSTLGWCLGAGVPCLFYEFEWMPVTFGGMVLDQPGVKGLKSLRLLLGEEVLGDQGSRSWFKAWLEFHEGRTS